MNLDEERAARREAAGMNPELVFGGEKFVLPVELPIDAVKALGSLSKASKAKDSEGIQNALVATVEGLLDEEQLKAFMSHRPSIGDLAALVAGIPAEYGIETGESQAAAKPSRTTSRQPKQTSKPSTD